MLRQLIGALLLFVCASSTASAVSARAGTGFYIGANYTSFISGKASTVAPRQKEAEKFGTVDKGLLLSNGLETFGGKAGFSVLGFGLEAEGLYGRVALPEDGVLLFNTEAKSDLHGFTYFLGLLNANLEFSGMALFSPYIGVGVGTGTVAFSSVQNAGQYGFPIVTQVRAGLVLDLGVGSLPIRPYFGYRMLMLSGVGAKKFSDIPGIVPSDKLDEDSGIMARATEIVRIVGKISHTLHNFEIGIRIHMG